jgi:poly [ADP-ribose] polymerase 6/8
MSFSEEEWSDNAEWSDSEYEETYDNDADFYIKYILELPKCIKCVKNDFGFFINIEIESILSKEQIEYFDINKKYFQIVIKNFEENTLKIFINNNDDTIYEGNIFILTNNILKYLNNIDYEENFILYIYKRIKGYFSTINNRCICCDNDLKYPSMRPFICNENLCFYKFNELNIGFSLKNIFLNNTKIIEFIISLCKEGLKSKFQMVCIPENYSKTEIENLLNLYDIIELVDKANNSKTERDFRNQLPDRLYNLLIYLYNSVQFTLKMESEYIKKNQDCLHTTKIKLISNGQKEHEFLQLKNKYGSETYYHGSHISNWHNIIRMNLKNYSGTTHQQNGAAYGNGIYLSDIYDFAKTYSSKITKDISIVAECEVIKFKNWKQTINIYVVPNEKYVIIRKLIITKLK